jgi:hypothetical protein
MSPDLARAVRRVGPFALAALGIVVIAFASIAFIGSQGFAFDYRAYDLAARRIASGEPLYLADTVARYNSGTYADLYLYPPQMAIALVPLTAFVPATAALVWYWLRIGMLLAGCALLPVRPWVRLATLGVSALSFPVLYDLNLGNISLVVFALSALIWRLGSRPAAGVVLAVLMAIRYPFGIVGLAWLAMRRWKVLAVTIVTGLVLLAVALPIVGLTGYLDYLTILRGLRDISTGPDNISVDASLRGAGVSAAAAGLVSWAVIVATAAFTWLVARRRDADTATVVALTAPLLAAPFFHPHYLVAMLLPAAFLADRGHPWGLLLPLLGWLPGPYQPLVAALGMIAPLAARSRAQPGATGASAAAQALRSPGIPS